MRVLAAGLGVLLVAGFVGPRAPTQEVPEEARKQLVDALGGPFVVFRDKVQDDLKLSAAQKEKLDQELHERIADAMQFFESLTDVKGPEREKRLQAYRRKAHEKLAVFLKETLNEDQRKRMRQLQLQQEGPVALGGEVGKELHVTDAQRKQFMAIVQDLQKKVEPLIKDAESGGNPEEIRPKVMKLRKEHEARILAVLTEAQRMQWQQLLGKRLDLDD